MKDNTKLTQLIEEMQGMNENQLADALSYFKSMKWISQHPGESEAAEKKLQQIQNIINGTAAGTPQKVSALTLELDNIIAAAAWGMPK